MAGRCLVWLYEPSNSSYGGWASEGTARDRSALALHAPGQLWNRQAAAIGVTRRACDNVPGRRTIALRHKPSVGMTHRNRLMHVHGWLVLGERCRADLAVLLHCRLGCPRPLVGSGDSTVAGSLLAAVARLSCCWWPGAWLSAS